MFSLLSNILKYDFSIIDNYNCEKTSTNLYKINLLDKNNSPIGKIWVNVLNNNIIEIEYMSTFVFIVNTQENKKMLKETLTTNKIVLNPVLYNLIKFMITDIEPNKIYTTQRVYANRNVTLNGVIGCNLKTHVEYNLTFRPGTAFFINGECISKGYLNHNQIAVYSNMFKTDTKYTKTENIVPYV